MEHLFSPAHPWKMRGATRYYLETPLGRLSTLQSWPSSDVSALNVIYCSQRTTPLPPDYTSFWTQYVLQYSKVYVRMSVLLCQSHVWCWVLCASPLTFSCYYCANSSRLNNNSNVEVVAGTWWETSLELWLSPCVLPCPGCQIQSCTSHTYVDTVCVDVPAHSTYPHSPVVLFTCCHKPLYYWSCVPL